MKKNDYALPLAFLTMLFFMWGFITCLNDILVPHFKAIFTLSYFESTLVQFAFFVAYFVGSVIYFFVSSVAGDPINRIGYKNGILLGLFIAAIGTFLFYPAAQMQSFGFFLAALFILALGCTLLQIAANPYVIMLGNPETGSHRLSLAGAINSFGTTIAPIIGGVLILGNSSGNDINSVKMPYLVFTGAFILLMIIFKIISLPRFTNDQSIEKGTGALRYPQLTLGILAIFFYVGGEVTVGSFMTSYVGLPDVKSIPQNVATLYVALYWGSLMIGRFTGSVSVFNLPRTVKRVLMAVLPVVTFFFILLIFKIKSGPGEVIDYHSMIVYYLPFIVISIIAFFIGQEKPARTLLLFSGICILLLIIALLSKGDLAMWSVISLGLYNSIMWPSIFALAIAGLGKHTSQGSSLLVMGILGGALIPPVQGFLADHVGVHLSFVVPIVCYIYLAFYAWRVTGILKAQGIDYDATMAASH